MSILNNISNDITSLTLFIFFFSYLFRLSKGYVVLMLVALVPGYFFTALTVDCMGHRVLQVSVLRVLVYCLCVCVCKEEDVSVCVRCLCKEEGVIVCVFVRV
jgi:hypothetical protein